MEIFGLEKVSFVDYENQICATVFTGGCNFLCPFCHNSGLVKKDFQKYEVEEVLSYLSSRKSLLDAVTISGGEPTLQKDLPDFISKVKSLGYKIKLDTNGTNPEMLSLLIKKNLIDYVAMDIKSNFDDYSSITGVPSPNVERIKKSLSVLKNSGIAYELRTTLVKEFHSQKNIEKMVDELGGHKTLYLQKFVDSGSCMKANLNDIPKSEAEKFKQILEQKVENVMLRGY